MTERKEWSVEPCEGFHKNEIYEGDRYVGQIVRPNDAATVVAAHNAQAQLHKAADDLGRWLSPALDDPDVCDAMKADVQAWFDAGQPLPKGGDATSTNVSTDTKPTSAESAYSAAPERPNLGGGNARLCQGGWQEPQPVAWQWQSGIGDWREALSEDDAKFCASKFTAGAVRPLYTARAALSRAPAGPQKTLSDYTLAELQAELHIRAMQVLGPPWESVQTGPGAPPRDETEGERG